MTSRLELCKTRNTFNFPPTSVLDTAMAATEAARSSYLEKASLTLLVTAPIVSASIGIQRNSADENYNESTPESTMSCSSCGNIVVPGRQHPTTLSRGRTRSSRIGNSSVGMKLLPCSLCGKTIAVPARKKKRAAATSAVSTLRPMHAEKMSDAMDDTGDHKKPEHSTTTEPARKRARGKQTTLQSMLAGQKGTTTVGPKGSGLSLMDFIKT